MLPWMNEQEAGVGDDQQVHQNAAESRFEIVIGMQTAGYVTYRDEPGVRVFLHAEVEPAFEGKGVGSRLAEGALKATREAGLRVEPQCDFIAVYIQRHQEHADLVSQPPRH
jgi:uncharacterized protein